ncbi:MAG TPA: hypothetical protein VKA31_11395 [Mariprofundaceae bacterium]|nr:hypothetical protein [Mariprofundaceae bacterium]
MTTNSTGITITIVDTCCAACSTGGGSASSTVAAITTGTGGPATAASEVVADAAGITPIAAVESSVGNARSCLASGCAGRGARCRGAAFNQEGEAIYKPSVSAFAAYAIIDIRTWGNCHSTISASTRASASGSIEADTV